MAVQLKPIDPTNQYNEVQRLNYYTILWVQKGSGRYRADISEYPFGPGTIFFFTPYQPFRFMHAEQASGLVLHFHPDFFCIEKHKKEVSCNGVLFNNVYQPPTITVSGKDALALTDVLQKFREEMSSDAIAKYDLLVSWLKIFLITASRIKIEQHPEAVRFEYEWHDASGQWFRSYGNELWEFDEDGYMRKRFASINDLEIGEKGRKL